MYLKPRARTSIAHRSLSLLAAAIAAASVDAAPAPGEQWSCTPTPDGWRCHIREIPATPYGYPDKIKPLPGKQGGPQDIDPADELAHDMDWSNRRQLTDAQCENLPTQCSGAYIEPPMEPVNQAATQIGTVFAYSDESELTQDPETATFSGNVTLHQDDKRLRADTAVLYRAEHRAVIDGDVQYREPGVLIRGESAEFDTEDKSGEVRKARFVLHNESTRGKADRIFRNADGTVDLEDGTYTQCEPGQQDWRIAASEIHLDRATGQGIARSARLEVEEIPVLWTPYIRFPIDDRRMTGFLWPALTNSSQNGFDLATPYYLNLAPNYDATLVPRYLNDRGTMGSGEFRYLNTWSEWSFSGAYLPDDDVYKDDRWLTGVQQQGLLLGKLKTRIDFTEVSDEEYLKNLSTTGLEIQRSTHLNQIAEAAYNVGDGWRVKARAQQYQVLDDELREPYKMLPRIEINRDWTAEPFKPDYALTAEYTYFEHKDDSQITGQRVFLEPRIAFPMEWMAGFIRPTLSYQYIGYALDNSTRTFDDDNPSVDAARFSLDSGLFFERDTTWFGTAMQQTLEPRVYYLWSDYADHSGIPNFDSSNLTFSVNQLFRDTRFSGHDRIADANQVSASVTTRFIDSRTGAELLSASLGQIYYLEDRRVSLSGSPSAVQEADESEIAAALSISPSESLRLSATAVWNTETDELEEAGALLNWTPGEAAIVNLSYRQRDEGFNANALDPYENVDQADFSAVIPVGDHWKVFTRYQYDLENEDNLEELAGIEFASCCWAVRMVYQEGVDWDNGRDRGFYLQFVLRGLGGLGQNIDQLLQSSIFGFGTRNKENTLGY